ncbi:ABC transporter permease [uncultured Brevundimonas sp.]|uniref:ABC transporter permease n=1 Tax=uncultured Brevundimonas sp. TaxID=213418 RepID=UPI0025F667D9|nr:ABC transporter permease [uncultured Brevundimonas sp.]
MIASIRYHSRVIGALFMRETITRYGREGLGFLWLIGEPLIFCLGVMGLWAVIKPEYEHGVRVAPFVMTGYMCLLLFRHIVGYNLNALQANVGLMHHRAVKPLHIYVSRALMEFAGATVAFAIVYAILLVLGAVSRPHDILLLYGGWLILFWFSTGLSLTFSALSIRFEVMERVVPVFMYLMIPLSGAFIMVDWLPDAYQKIYLLIPMPHTVEMVRGATFGEFVPTHYHPWYPIAWSAALTLTGLTLLATARQRVDVE